MIYSGLIGIQREQVRKIHALGIEVRFNLSYKVELPEWFTWRQLFARMQTADLGQIEPGSYLFTGI